MQTQMRDNYYNYFFREVGRNRENQELSLLYSVSFVLFQLMHNFFLLVPVFFYLLVLAMSFFVLALTLPVPVSSLFFRG